MSQPHAHLAYAPRGAGLLYAVMWIAVEDDIYGWFIGSKDGETLASYFMLQDYYAGPVVSQTVGPRPPYHGLEREGDIAWVLEYFADAPATP